MPVTTSSCTTSDTRAPPIGNRFQIKNHWLWSVARLQCLVSNTCMMHSRCALVDRIPKRCVSAHVSSQTGMTLLLPVVVDHKTKGVGNSSSLWNTAHTAGVCCFVAGSVWFFWSALDANQHCLCVDAKVDGHSQHSCCQLSGCLPRWCSHWICPFTFAAQSTTRPSKWQHRFGQSANQPHTRGHSMSWQCFDGGQTWLHRCVCQRKPSHTGWERPAAYFPWFAHGSSARNQRRSDSLVQDQDQRRILVRLRLGRGWMLEIWDQEGRQPVVQQQNWRMDAPERCHLLGSGAQRLWFQPGQNTPARCAGYHVWAATCARRTSSRWPSQLPAARLIWLCECRWPWRHFARRHDGTCISSRHVADN